MDETRPPASGQASGHVEPTPEVEPLDTLDLRVVDAAETAAGAAPPSPPPPTPIRPGSDRGADGGGVAGRLKPVAAAAEEIAATAVSLSAKGLSRLAGILEERRRRRGGGDQGG